MRIHIKNPQGEVPRKDARELPDNFAQVARNCKFGNGRLAPFRGLRAVDAPAIAGTIKTLFRWAAEPDADADGAITAIANTSPVEITSAGHGLVTGGRVFITGTGLAIDAAAYRVTVTSADTFTLDATSAAGTAAAGHWTRYNGYWFAWPEAVDAVKGPIAGDTFYRTYFTGTGQPQMTYDPVAIQGGGPYPAVSYDLGVPAPAHAPVVTVSGPAPDDPADYVSRTYAYTYVSELEEEGAPSPASVVVKVGPEQTVSVIGMDTGPTAGNYNLATKRLYRAAQGAEGVAYELVTEVSLATTSFTDDLDDDQLDGLLVSADWSMPPPDGHSLVALANGVLVMASKNQVCPSVPYQPHAYPVGYRQATDYDIVGLGVLGQGVLALTEADAYLVDGTAPESMTSTPLKLQQGCMSARSIVSVGNLGVAYAAPDGLMLVSRAVAKIITGEYLTRDQWQALNPASIHGYLLDGQYVGFYDNGTTKGGFIFDPSKGGQGYVPIDTYATAGFSDPLTDSLYLVVDGLVQRWDADTLNRIVYLWRSKVFQQPYPVSAAIAEVRAKSYDDLILRVYADDVQVAEVVVADREPFWLPAADAAEDFEVELEGADEVQWVTVADDITELGSGS